MQSRAMDHHDLPARVVTEYESLLARSATAERPGGTTPDVFVRQEAEMTTYQPLSSEQRLATVAEIDERIASGRQRYIAAYFAGNEGEAQFWVYDIERLENLRNIVQRQQIAS